MLRALWAFDFDGVICDSAREVGMTAWRASFVEWPQLRDQWPDEPPAEILDGFGRIRPALETGWEAMLMLHVLMDQAGKGLGAPEPDKFAADFHTKIKPSLLQRLNSTEEALAKRFDDARNTWIESDRESWLAANAFYPTARDAVAALLAARSNGSASASRSPSQSPNNSQKPTASETAKSPVTAGETSLGGGGVSEGNSALTTPREVLPGRWKHDIFILTTKSKEFALELLDKAGLRVRKDNVFGRGSGPKTETLQLLAAQDEYAAVIFVEDRLPALEHVASSSADGDCSLPVALPPPPPPPAGSTAAAAAAGAAAADKGEGSSNGNGAVTAVSLLLAGWGYNTPNDKRKAAESGEVVLLGSQEAFAAFVEAFLVTA